MTGFRTFGPAEIRGAVRLADLVEPVARVLAEFSQGRGESPIVVFAGRPSFALPGSPLPRKSPRLAV